MTRLSDPPLARGVLNGQLRGRQGTKVFKALARGQGSEGKAERQASGPLGPGAPWLRAARVSDIFMFPAHRRDKGIVFFFLILTWGHAY